MTKVLLADDSLTIQKVVELVLADEGFEIKTSNNGADALAMLSSFTPDIILADIEMPKINGYQLCEKIKSSPATRNIPVILLAGAFEPLDEELIKNVGADDFLIKPFESEDLIKKVNSSLMVAGKVEKPSEVEVEPLLEAEAVEASVASEDLWAMEELEGVAIEEEPVVAKEEPVEGIESLAEIEEITLAPEEAIKEEVIEEIIKPSKEWVSAPMPEISTEEMMDAFKKAVDGQLQKFLLTLDLKKELIPSLSLSIKDSVEKILWEVTPELTEKLLRETLKGAIDSITKEVEKVIWETVPELAESIIRKEIEKIKSEI